MKKLLTLAFALILVSSAASYAQESGLARPKKVDGVPVYVMCEPVEEYEVIGKINTGLMQGLTAFASDNSTDAMNITELVQTLVNRAQRKERKGKVEEFDAIITENGDYGTLIRFVKEGE